VSGEPRDIPLPVTFVRSMTTPSGVRIHDWRSSTSGRIFEVPEVHVYAVGTELREGDGGFLRFSGGQLYVVRTEADPVPARRPTSPSRRGATGQAPRRAPEQDRRQEARGERRSRTSRTTRTTTGNATRYGPQDLTSRLTRWLAQARRRADRVRLPRLSSTQWFLSMLGVLLLVIVVRLILG